MTKSPTLLIATVVFLLCWTSPALAHRLDEYLEATTIDVGANALTVQLRLTPGVDVFRSVLAEIDANGDGLFSDAERQAYADRVRRDLSLAVDGQLVPLKLVSATFPEVEAMKGGLGEIDLRFEATPPPARTGDRQLTLENRFHQSGAAVYLVNCLVPRDPRVRVVSQDRSYDQSVYRLAYTQAPQGPAAAPTSWLHQTGGSSLFKAYVYHGVRHILTGYDHLLFVSALVLAATTLLDLIKVVTAFTLAHTITLTLGALNLVHLSERIVEPLIAASIVVVALQNVFWPRRARGWPRLAAAFFFGLFHGLGFAGGLLDAMREMQSGTLAVAILAFSLGVETGHQLVVLPLFGFLKATRHTQRDAVGRTRVATAFQRIGSAGISIAGIYYLCVALRVTGGGS